MQIIFYKSSYPTWFTYFNIYSQLLSYFSLYTIFYFFSEFQSSPRDIIIIRIHIILITFVNNKNLILIIDDKRFCSDSEGLWHEYVIIQ